MRFKTFEEIVNYEDELFSEGELILDDCQLIKEDDGIFCVKEITESDAIFKHGNNQYFIRIILFELKKNSDGYYDYDEYLKNKKEALKKWNEAFEKDEKGGLRQKLFSCDCRVKKDLKFK